MSKFNLPRSLSVAAMAAVLAGCGKNDVQVYKIAKDPSGSQPGDAMTVPAPTGQPGAPPRLKWKLPDGWQELAPGEMRVASFKVNGDGGKSADVSVIPLPGFAGGDLSNVNRWRGQVGLAPISDEELAKLAEKVTVGGQDAMLFDLAGTAASGDQTRILAAVQHRDGLAWFFKMTGDGQLVEQQKGKFEDFLKSVEFGAAGAQGGLPAGHPQVGDMSLPSGHPEMNGMSGASMGAINTQGQPKWEVPSGWKEIPGGQFLVAKFSLTGENGAAAAVNVSNSGGDGGGLAANFNRWRGQLGLGTLDEAELQKQVKEIDVAGGKASVIEMSGRDARSGQAASLVGAVVSRDGQTWFYKLMGDATVVQNQKDAFTKFVQSVQY